MFTSRRSAGLLAASAGLAALAFSLARSRRNSHAGSALKGKVVLINGGSRGLGFAIASELASQGAKLILISRHSDELERARARLLAGGTLNPEDVLIQVADVSDAVEIREVVSSATAYYGQIDAVVNNAGVILVGPVESQTLGSFRMAMNINFFGALHTTQAVLPQMLARGEGAIVNIGSIGGKVAFPHLLPYVASKFALVGWSQGLRAELSAKGIQVTTVAPGIMRTGSHIQARFSGNAEEEYRWFAAAASFPATASSARSAARKVVKALRNGTAEISIGLQAILAGRLAGLSPESTAAALALANGFLPEPPPNPGSFWAEDRSVKGEAFRGSLPSLLERFGSSSINRFNQE